MITLDSTRALSIRLPKGAGGGTEEVRIDTLPETIIYNLLQHGLQQKMADPAAGMAKAGKGESEIKTACLAVLERLRAGTWADRSVGPRAGNLEEFINQEAKKKAMSRILAAEAGKDAQVKAIVEKVGKEPALTAIAARYAADEGFRSATQKLWEARTTKAEIDLGDLEV